MDNNPQALKPQEKKGFFDRLGFFQKALLFVGVVIVLILSVMIVLGGIKSFYEFFFYLCVFSIFVIGAYVVIKSVGIIFQPKYYSPREDLFTKWKNDAIDYCPNNIKGKTLYFQGDIGKQKVEGGSIKGCIVLPHLIGDIKRGKDGNVLYSEKKTFDGKQIPQFENVRGVSDGDTFFVVTKGFFLWEKTHYIRCHRDLHSTLHGDVTIFDINPIRYGNFEYPYKQYQLSLGQVMLQNQLETIIATHEHQHDLISQSTDSGLYANPYYRIQIKQNAELGQQPQG